MGLIDSNPAKTGVDNPQPPRREMRPFDSHAELDRLAAELGPGYGPMVLFAAATGLRPGEWIALEQRDIDLDYRVVHVRRAFPVNRLKTTKTDTPRAVPLQRSALEALDQFRRHPARRRCFSPPPRAASSTCTTGVLATGALRSAPPASTPTRRLYDLRHTFDTVALRAGLGTFELTRYMGTSLINIDRTYGHLARDSHRHAIELLDDGCRRVDAAGRSRDVGMIAAPVSATTEVD